ncbi:hypothetical protein HOY80DRAFT_1023378 [Tuber brumale]|nr:hypothetical protein HOY80DRAFT_1023378 [Tuber brumale]
MAGRPRAKPAPPRPVTNSTRYQGRASGKEADSAFKLGTRLGRASWPTLVLENGVSETIERLRVDTNWWLTNSPASGRVNIVLVFSIKKAASTIEIEQWEAVNAPPQHDTRRTASSTDPVPKCVQTITIPQPNDDERTLTLDFKKVLDRDPVGDTLEANFEFTPFDLSKWAAGIWCHDCQGEF